MKKPTIILAFTLIFVSAYSQESADSLWKFGGVTALNFSQLSLSNWAAGGENSVSANAMVNLIANYKSLNEKINWNNEMLLGYGLVQQGEGNFRKSDDKVDIASKLGYKASKHWSYTGLISFKTQFTEGYTNPGEVNQTKISNLMAPAYLNSSIGMDYKPFESLTIFLAPLTSKITFVLDNDLAAKGSFGLDAGEKIRSEFGGYIKIAFVKEIMKNVKLNTKIDLFSNYLENPQYVDVNFDMLLTLKVNKFLSASFISTVIYDHDIQFDILDSNDIPTGETEPRVQIKELFGIGLTYSF